MSHLSRSLRRSRALRAARRPALQRGRRHVVEMLEDRRMLDASGLLQTLENPTPETSDRFGNAGAASADYLVVGASGDDTYATDAGAAYLFDATTGSLLRTLNNPTPAASDTFGNSVAVSGNWVVVGASSDDTGATNAGAAYLFDALTGNLLRTLNNPTPAASEYFGRSVAVSGNFVVVGANGDNTGAAGAGSAYVFDATTGNLLRTLNNPTPEASDYFGYSVAVSGNVVIVGAYSDETGASGAGSAYIFDASTGSLLRTLDNPAPAPSDYFGYSVSIAGNTAVVSAYMDDAGATDAGTAYLFDATTGNLLHTLDNPNSAASDTFGYSVAISGNTVAVGATGADLGGINTGAVYLFDAATGALLQTVNNPTLITDNFGLSVSMAGGRVVVGASANDTGAKDAGAAYVFGPADSGPWVTTRSPADESIWIDDNTNLTIAFSEYVQKGIGSIVIKRAADGSVVESIDVNSGQVTVSGAIVTIDPTTTLAAGTTYYVEVSSGAFQDQSGNVTTAIGGPAAWNFTTLNYIPLAALPALHSNPGASKAIYLDFNGHVEPVFGSYTNAATTAYDIDGDPTTLSDIEVANIRTIWETMVEDFAPFNVDITTVEPAVLAPGRPIADANGVALRIAIGSEVNDWSPDSYGASFFGSWDNSAANVAFAFADAARPVAGTARYASRGAGYSCWVPTQAWTGTVMAFEPITSYVIYSYDYPAIWYDGTDPLGYHKDDMEILAGEFGARPDDFGNTTATATALTQSGGTWSGAGTIGANTDVDVFSFTVASAGVYRIAANAAKVAPNLDAVLELRNAAGQLIAVASPQDTQSAQIVKSLSPGQYFISVQSTGVYGWIGRYTVAIDSGPPAGLSVLTTVRTLTTGEDGLQASFQVQLQTQPTAVVAVSVVSSSTAQGTVAPASLTFTPDNWNVLQTVTVTGVNDAVDEVDAAYKILLTSSSTDPAYNTPLITKASITNVDNDTKFYVVNDATPDKTFEYATSGSQAESYSLNSGNTSPRGVATTVAGDKTWVVDANRKVYVYNTSGGLLGSWTAGSLNTKAKVEDITVYGNDVWIVDAYSDKVYKYANAAARTSGTQNATSSFNLTSSSNRDSDNRDPKGIVTDGTYLWVVNDSIYPDRVFKYTLTGQFLGSWLIDAHNAQPTGLTINPAAPSSIWIVDSGTKSVYQYANATTTTTGVRNVYAVFPLAPGNTNPQGIADPPAPGSYLVNESPAAATVANDVDVALESLYYEPVRQTTLPRHTRPEATPIAPRVALTRVADANYIVGTSANRVTIDSRSARDHHRETELDALFAAWHSDPLGQLNIPDLEM